MSSLADLDMTMWKGEIAPTLETDMVSRIQAWLLQWASLYMHNRTILLANGSQVPLFSPRLEELLAAVGVTADGFYVEHRQSATISSVVALLIESMGEIDEISQIEMDALKQKWGELSAPLLFTTQPYKQLAREMHRAWGHVRALTREAKEFSLRLQYGPRAKSYGHAKTGYGGRKSTGKKEIKRSWPEKVAYFVERLAYTAHSLADLPRQEKKDIAKYIVSKLDK